MRRFTILLTAATLLVAPVAQAQQHRQQPEQQQRKVEQPIKKNHWRKGGKLPSPGKYSESRDYRKHGLRAPGKDQRWVRVDGQYLLIAAATGAIIAVATGR